MANYYDSSLILANILQEQHQPDYSEIWDGEGIRISSVLLKAECIVSLRRAAAAQGYKADHGWVRERIEALTVYFETITFKFVDDSIQEIIRREKTMANCRTLDAIHLATASYFQPHLDEPVQICTMDHRMRGVAVELGFGVLPKELF